MQKDANNIENIALGALSPADALAVWKKSKAHRGHLLGINPFYRAHSSALHMATW